MNEFVLSSKRNSGAVLLMVLWAIVILGGTTMILIKTIEWDATNHAVENHRFEAYQTALSGLQIGINPESDLLNNVFLGQDSLGRNYELKVESESAKININRVLLENRHDILERLFTQWRVPSSQINGLIDRLADWVDSDELKRLNGAELQDYQNAGLDYVPANNLFRSLQDIRMVLGVRYIIDAKPDWRDYLTIYGDGRLDINTAHKDCIMAYLDLSASQADAIIAYRDREKKLNPLSQGIRDMQQLQNILGYDDQKIQKIETYITFLTEVQKINSTGYSGQCQRVIKVVLKRNQHSAAEYYSWEER